MKFYACFLVIMLGFNSIQAKADLHLKDEDMKFIYISATTDDRKILIDALMRSIGGVTDAAHRKEYVVKILNPAKAEHRDWANMWAQKHFQSNVRIPLTLNTVVAAYILASENDEHDARSDLTQYLRENHRLDYRQYEPVDDRGAFKLLHHFLDFYATVELPMSRPEGVEELSPRLMKGFVEELDDKTKNSLKKELHILWEKMMKDVENNKEKTINTFEQVKKIIYGQEYANFKPKLTIYINQTGDAKILNQFWSESQNLPLINEMLYEYCLLAKPKADELVEFGIKATRDSIYTEAHEFPSGNATWISSSTLLDFLSDKKFVTNVQKFIEKLLAENPGRLYPLRERLFPLMTNDWSDEEKNSRRLDLLMELKAKEEVVLDSLKRAVSAQQEYLE